MKKTIIAFLTALIILVGGFFYLNAQKQKKENEYYSPYQRFEEMRKEIFKMMKENEKINSDFFDKFFNDDFFSGKYNPFREMQEIHKSIVESLEKERKEIFKDSWEQWFNNRISTQDIKVEKKETDKNIIMEITVPDKNAQIQIKDGYLKISYEKINSVEKEEKNSKFKSYTSQKMLKILPVPENADPEKHNVEIKDDKIIITFDKIKK